jgi:[protein-PII] uridylyltransferase
VAEDVQGLLANVTGVLTAHRISIDGAVVSTRDPGPGEPAIALDLFYVRDSVGETIPREDKRWERVRADLAAVRASGDARAAVAELLARKRSRSRLKPRVTPGVPTAIQLLNDASEKFTVIEVATQDRVGVLHAITRAVADLGLDIHLAKVSTEGEKVADAFYVARRADGAKVTDASAMEALEQAIGLALAQVGRREG